MPPQTIPRTLAAATAVVAAVLVLLARGPSDDPLPMEFPAATAPAPTEESVVIAAADPPAPSNDALIAAKVRELEQMSETFRNSTFLIAIRDAGFVCNDLLRVYGGLDDSGKWTATCSEMLAYTVSVAGRGTVHIEPMLQYFDGTTPSPIPLDESGNRLRGPDPISPPPRR